MNDQEVSIYRLIYSTAGQEISPGHVWGTVEAISTLPCCVPLPATERKVPATMLDANGFLFEHAYADLVEIQAPASHRAASRVA